MKSREVVCANLAQALMDYLELMCEPRDEPAAETRLYTYTDLAKMFRKSQSTIGQWVREGKFGEPVKTGTSIRVTQAGVNKYIRDHSSPTEKRAGRTRPRPAGGKTTPRGQPLGI